MNSHDVPESTPDQQTVAGSFAVALAWVTFWWLVAAAMTVAVVYRVEPAGLLDALLIASGSLLIAVLSMLPGLSFSRHSGSIVVAMMAGILIRLIGTVALFLTCRYQMASRLEMITAMSVGWYVFLTMIEVYVLGRSLPRQVTSRRSDNTPYPAGV